MIAIRSSSNPRTKIALSLAALLAALLGAPELHAQGAVDPNEPMPAGHPSVDDSAPLEDRVGKVPDLPPGTAEISIRDEADRPMPGVLVRLGEQKQDVAEGDSKTNHDATTDDRGIAVFSGLPTASSYSYRAIVARGPAEYASSSFGFDERNGVRALLHVYPVTRDLRGILLGMRGVVFVEPREDVFQIEASFEVFNLGRTSWVPEGVRISLPPGAKAFRAPESTSDTRVERAPGGDLLLLGTFAPGQRQVSFQFQMENPHESAFSFRLDLPPRIAELRVISTGARGLKLDVSGSPSGDFPSAEPAEGRDGSRLLVTGRRMNRGENPLESIVVSLNNVPVPSTGRWYAVGLALLVALFGLQTALRRSLTPEQRGAGKEELERAERLVLNELLSLERLRSADQIGPRTYESTRAELLAALARLGSLRAAETA